MTKKKNDEKTKAKPSKPPERRPSLEDEWSKQDTALGKLGEQYEFPLFSAARAIESQRRSAYRDTASAALEIVDNAMESKATWIHVVMDPIERKVGKRTRKGIGAVAFVDNGAGMSPDMIRFALSWGGGTRFDDPEFIGKFGFGLPNASINQARRARVYSRRNKQEPWMAGTLDIDVFVKMAGVIKVDPAEEAELPTFVSEYLTRNGLQLEHGTVVVWENPDRLSYARVRNLAEHLVERFGVVYRYLLGDIELKVEGQEVTSVDPLFLTKGARFYVAEEGAGAKQTVDRSIPVAYWVDEETGEPMLKQLESKEDYDAAAARSDRVIGTIVIKAAYFPLGFSTGQQKAGHVSALDEYAAARFAIRLKRRGMSFVRAGREIETVDIFPRSARDRESGLGKWPLLQSYAYHWGFEVSFSPELDDVFGITNDKQGVRPIPEFWKLMTGLEMDKHASYLNRMQSTLRRELQSARMAAAVKAQEGATGAEQAMAAVDIARGRRRKPAARDRDQTEKKKKKAAEKRASEKKETLEEALKAVERENRRRPYKVEYVDEPNGPFYRPEWRDGAQVVVLVNKSHSFFATLYSAVLDVPGDGLAKDAVDALLLCLAAAELATDVDETSEFYRAQREDIWTVDLNRVMSQLASRHANRGEEEDDREAEGDADEEAAAE